jgi:1,4-dihydroxy-2-naphthoyl-CoA hydrolase
MSADEHRETLGMPDVLERYPVPGPRSLDGILGFRLTEIGDTEARGEVEVADRVRQRFGIVHGGVYAALAEMVASEATVHHVWPRGDSAVGQANATSFLRPCRAGTLRAHARARHRGRTSWVWDIDLLDDDGRLCATSRVTMAVRPRPDD